MSSLRMSYLRNNSASTRATSTKLSKSMVTEKDALPLVNSVHHFDGNAIHRTINKLPYWLIAFLFVPSFRASRIDPTTHVRFPLDLSSMSQGGRPFASRFPGGLVLRGDQTTPHRDSHSQSRENLLINKGTDMTESFP
jgi:hypothetical protein